MRRANTTFVNLRAALDDVDPLVNASKPVAEVLHPFLDQLQPLRADAQADGGATCACDRPTARAATTT